MTDDGECYDSGPFCNHWSDPSDCDEKCANCGHECCRHWRGEECEDCDCKEFGDDDE